MRPPEPGDAAPAFALPSQAGRIVSLAALRGRTVVLWFYAEDGTPACSQQAADLRDAASELAACGAVVLGVSPDPPASHRAFREDLALPFDLLTDADHAVAAAYGAWGEKTLYGRKVVATIRSTFVVGPDGCVALAFRNVRAKGHVARVLAAMPEALKAQDAPRRGPRPQGRGRAR